MLNAEGSLRSLLCQARMEPVGEAPSLWVGQEGSQLRIWSLGRAARTLSTKEVLLGVYLATLPQESESGDGLLEFPLSF